EAVADGETGLVIRRPRDVNAVAGALRRLLDDDATRVHMGEAARRRAVEQFDYDALAARLDATLVELES
ncbi:MAG TPA: glycosyltransferase, partial [Acidimicrobiales bacterium]